MTDFENIQVEINNKVAYATLNRPEKANALNGKLWFEIGALMGGPPRCGGVGSTGGRERL